MIRQVLSRTERCLICDHEVPIQSITSPADGAPEMIRSLSTIAWVGLVVGDGRHGELLVACSNECAQKLLEE